MATGRMRARRVLRAAGIGVGLAVALAPSAMAAKPVQEQDLMLDSHAASGVPSVRTPGRLARGTFYVSEVAGTVSYYSSALWRFPPPGADPGARSVCGTPEAAPLFPSAVQTGPVGFDAEMIFARPALARRCQSPRLPQTWNNFQVSVGGRFGHPPPVFGRPTAPATGHSYVYVLKGRGAPAAFRLRDTPASDNYGMLRIRIRRARAADCTTYGVRGFGSRTSRDCRRRVS